MLLLTGLESYAFRRMPLLAKSPQAAEAANFKNKQERSRTHTHHACTNNSHPTLPRYKIVSISLQKNILCNGTRDNDLVWQANV